MRRLLLACALVALSWGLPGPAAAQMVVLTVSLATDGSGDQTVYTRPTFGRVVAVRVAARDDAKRSWIRLNSLGHRMGKLGVVVVFHKMLVAHVHNVVTFIFQPGFDSLLHLPTGMVGS